MQKSADAFRTISEVADDLSLPQHVLRFWETRFPQIRPLKRAGGRRYYRPADVSLLKTIRQLLYDDGYTIKGVQRLLKEQGVKGLSAGTSATEMDWLAPSDVDVEPDEPEASTLIVADDGLGMPPQRRDQPTVRLDGDLVRDALQAIDECRRLLDAVLKPSR